MHDRIGDTAGLDQFLLGELAAEIAAFLQTLGPDDRKRDMVFDAGSLFRRKQVAAGGLEELEHRLVLEGGRVGEVDDHLATGKRLGETFAGDGVDARIRRGGNHLMALLAQAFDRLGADQARSADNDDFHEILQSLRRLAALFDHSGTGFSSVLPCRGHRACRPSPARP
ncbi:hypothetical protein D9M72_405390 [compost metagenome]